MTDKDREIARLRSALLNMLHEFESDHEAIMDDEHEEDEAANPELCNYCRIIAEAHAALDATGQLVESAVAESPTLVVDVDCTLMAPNGKRIVKIIESVIVDYELKWIRRDEAGEIQFDYDASQSSEISWDSAEPTEDENGEYTFVDEENNYWKGSQLIKSTYPDDDYDSSKDDWYGDGGDGKEETEEEQEGQETS